MGFWSKHLKFLDKNFVQFLVIGAVGALVYSNTFHVPFVFDDRHSIPGNPLIQDLGRFLSEEGYRYNPRRFIGYLTFALNFHFGGLNVTGYHAVNLAIHVVTALLVCSLCRLAFRTPFLGSSRLAPEAGRIALTAGLLFVVHPVQTQAVTYIVQRLASLSTMFYLLSMVLYLLGRLRMEARGPRIEDGGRRTEDRGGNLLLPSVIRRLSSGLFVAWLLLAGSLISAALAMTTKEIAFTLPVMVALMEFLFFPGKARRGRRALLSAIAVGVPISLGSISMGLAGKGKSWADFLSMMDGATRLQTDMSRWEYLFTQFRVIVTYIRLLFLPVNQNLDYDYPIYSSFFAPPVLLSFLFLAALLSLALVLVFALRPSPADRPTTDPSARLIGFGILWFFCALSIESGFIPIVDVIFEHRLYLPSVGAFISTAVLGFWAVQKAEDFGFKKPRPLFLACLAGVLLLLGSATYLRNIVWQDGISLWKDVVAKSPEKPRGYTELGMYHAQDGRIEEARRILEFAVLLNSNHVRARNNLGAVYEMMGLYEKAEVEFIAAINIKLDAFEPRQNLAKLYNKMGRLKEAAVQYEKVIELNPNVDKINYCDLGTIYGKLGQHEESITILSIVLQKNPDFAEAHYNLGVAYYFLENMDDAFKEFKSAALLNSDHLESHYALFGIYQRMGNIQGMIEELQWIINLNKGDMEARTKLDLLLNVK